MVKLLCRCWNDDSAAVVSVEILLITAVLIFGLLPGLIAMRNSINASMITLGNLIVRLVPSFTFSGFAITGVNQQGAPVTILQIGGVQFTPNVQTLTADQIAPMVITGSVTIPPAP